MNGPDFPGAPYESVHRDSLDTQVTDSNRRQCRDQVASLGPGSALSLAPQRCFGWCPCLWIVDTRASAPELAADALRWKERYRAVEP